jgi:hypothetical protein
LEKKVEIFENVLEERFQVEDGFTNKLRVQICKTIQQEQKATLKEQDESL